MKNIKSAFIIFLLLPSLLVFGWGDKGHKTITFFAMKLLPHQMKMPETMSEAIIEHSVDPDHRKSEDKTEGPKHFIDIDFYKEFQDGRMIMSRDSLNNIYGEKVVTREGVLPWATEDTYKELVNAFKEKSKDNIILYASDLAHYVGDGHQPMHETVNYNGQLSGQKGVHARYESNMVNDYLDEIKESFKKQTPTYVKDIQDYIFNYLYESNSYLEVLLLADKFATEKTGGNFDKDYYRLLWFKTKYVTENEFNEGAISLASLIYSAWRDAGKPSLGK